MHFFSGLLFCCCVYLFCMCFCIVATCPSIPVARFAFRLCFIRFVLLFVDVLFGEPKPKQKQGRGLVTLGNSCSPGCRWLCFRWVFFVLSFSPLDVLDEIWNVIESVSEGFLTYSCRSFDSRVRLGKSPMRGQTLMPIKSI